MLVLNRKTNQAIQIGDNITITVMSINGSQVRIAVEAPKHIEVWREELLESAEEGEE